jgi:hypothetical protein
MVLDCRIRATHQLVHRGFQPPLSVGVWWCCLSFNARCDLKDKSSSPACAGFLHASGVVVDPDNGVLFLAKTVILAVVARLDAFGFRRFRSVPSELVVVVRFQRCFEGSHERAV